MTLSKLQQSTIGKRSRRKGASFQNTVARMLSKAWDIPVLSTPQSGGLSLKGDLCVGGNPPKYTLAYSVECKNRKDISIPVILRNPDILPISESQVVFFKEYGSKNIWLAFDVRKGPTGVAPIGIESPPPFIRIMRKDGVLLGVLRVDATYLQDRRNSFVSMIYRHSKKKEQDPEE